MYFCILIDPPAEVKLSTVSVLEEKVELKKGFGNYSINATAKSHPNITCSSVMITWVSLTKGNVHSCQAEGKENLIRLNQSPSLNVDTLFNIIGIND